MTALFSAILSAAALLNTPFTAQSRNEVYNKWNDIIGDVLRATDALTWEKDGADKALGYKIQQLGLYYCVPQLWNAKDEELIAILSTAPTHGAVEEANRRLLHRSSMRSRAFDYSLASGKVNIDPLQVAINAIPGS